MCRRNTIHNRGCYGVRRPWMSWSQRNELWHRWRAGESLTDIATALQRDHSRDLSHCRSGGRPRAAAAATCRCRLNHRRARRNFARPGRGASCAASRAASASAVDDQSRNAPPWRPRRAIARNGPIAGPGPARAAPKPCRLATRSALRAHRGGETGAATGRPSKSPAGFGATFPSDADMQVSHETIYRSLFVQSRGVLKRELLQHLRRQRRISAGARGDAGRAARRADRRCGLDSRTARRGRRPRGARALGGRLVVGAAAPYVATWSNANRAMSC